MIEPVFNPVMPTSGDSFDFADDLVKQLNTPYRNEFCVSVPCEDALLIGRPMFGLSMAGLPADAAPNMIAAGMIAQADFTNATITKNIIYAVPFIWDNAFEISQIGCVVTTGHATSKVRTGIYSAEDDLNGNFYPKTLLADSGEKDASTTGLKSATSLAVQLEPGHVYFAAFLCYTADATVTTLPRGAISPLLEVDATTFAPNWRYSVAYTLGSSTVGLPTAFPGGAVLSASETPPAVFLFPNRRSNHEAVILRHGYSPYMDGMVLRRVRLVRSTDMARVAGDGVPSIKIRGLVSNKHGSTEVGIFDSLKGALSAYEPRLISSGTDLRMPLPAGCVLSAETTQRGWAKVDVRDAAVLFDLAVV